MFGKLMQAGAILALGLSFTASARAGFLIAPESRYYMQLGGGQAITVQGTYAYGGWASLSNNGTSHDLALQGSIFRTTGLAAGTSLFTGIDLITDLVVTVANDPASFTASFSAVNSVAGNLTGSGATAYSGTICPSGCLGGVGMVTGQTLVMVSGTPFVFPTDPIGVGGTQTVMLGTATIAATGGPFVTGKVRITNVTTNVISMPTRTAAPTGVGITLEPTSQEVVKAFTTMGGFHSTMTTGQTSTVATVTLVGTNNLASASGHGQVTLVSPLRIDTGPLNVGNIPGKVEATYFFVPEPGVLLLFASGVAGLVVIGRRRLRSRRAS